MVTYRMYVDFSEFWGPKKFEGEMKEKYHLSVSLIALPRVIGKIRKCFLHFMFSFILLGYLMMPGSHSFNMTQISWFC